tara:strand:- start:1009 stop:1497 length:489 start_codon:yes stop_codon:yes gene_type:complete
MKNPIISIVMGSQSDWKTLSVCYETIKEFNIPVEKKIVSAHRTPERLYQYAKSVDKSSIKIIIAGAGGAAHLPGMIASLSRLPVLGVPIESKTLKGIDSLLSIVQMPAGIAVPTLAIGVAGAKNAALAAIAILSLSDENLLKKYITFRKSLTKSIPTKPKSK